MTLSLRRAVTVTSAVLAAFAVTAAPASAKGANPTTDVRVIAFNDFHGNLEPPSGSSGRVTLPDGSTVNADQVLGPPRPGRKIVITGDTAPSETIRFLLICRASVFCASSRTRTRPLKTPREFPSSTPL